MLKHYSQTEVRNTRASFFMFATFVIAVAVSSTALAANGGLSAKIDKARELVLRGDRTGAIKSLKEISRDTVTPVAKSRSKTPDGVRELAKAWLEIAEVFLTDKGQNQFSLAESIWLAKPKEALDVLSPLLKAEDDNLQISRLGARSALRIGDCVRADSFAQQAELVFPLGSDVKLLRLQIQDCLNGTNFSAPALKLSPESEPAEVEGAFRLLSVKDALRKKDLKMARVAVVAWEASKSAGAAENPQFWYWKWRVSNAALATEASASGTREAMSDRTAARKYLHLCLEMTPRRRKALAIYPELCLATETVESELKSSDKAGT